MSAAVHRSTPVLSIPQTQNTALVIEFDCLYTHDLRRKQKRWQDGFLRYHTFNKRAMVYDVPRNFLGDHHCTQGGDLQEGDEMTLEKSGIVVQVAEEIGRTETDLSELFQRKDKSSPSKNPSPIPSAPHRATPHTQASRPANTRIQTPFPNAQTKHKSLSSLLGPSRGSRGRIGKAALPTTSPFEARNSKQEKQDTETARQKPDAWNVTRTSKATKPTSITANSSSRQKSASAARASLTKRDKTQQRLDVTDVIDLTEDGCETGRHDHANEHYLLTSSPVQSTMHPPLPNGAVSRDSSLLQRNYVSEDTIPDPSPTAVDSPSVRHLQRKQPFAAPNIPPAKRVRRTSPAQPTRDQAQSEIKRRTSPPVSTTSNISADTGRPLESPFFSNNATSQKPGKALKLVGSAPRRMLVFQGHTSKAFINENNEKVDRQRHSEEHLPNRGRSGTRENGHSAHQAEREPVTKPQSIHRQRLQERMTRIGQRLSITVEAGEPAKARQVSTNGDRVDEARPAARAVEQSAERRLSQSKETAGSERPLTHQRDTSRGSPSVPHLQAQDTRSASDNQRGHASCPSPYRLNLHIASISDSAKDMSVPARSNTVGKNNTKEASTCNIGAEGMTPVMPSKPLKAPKVNPPQSANASLAKHDGAPVQDLDLGPWSEEAFDLLDWRPPDRDAKEEKV
ncbi:hypothetical protein BDV97DRAFT_56598 [Delphinella strobiligena]|nr:hypothetical protein BDV97DRAFT_56598 [Delphinella strobiligena]